jgi:hypothetical protein
VDKPIEALWNNFVRNGKNGAKMELVVGPYGLRAVVGLPLDRKPTEYFANRWRFHDQADAEWMGIRDVQRPPPMLYAL